MKEAKIIGIDPGNKQSGICVMAGNRIAHASEEENIGLFSKIKELSGGEPVIVVIEDLQPFMMRLTPEVIDTAKFIGEISYRLTTSDFVSIVSLVPRNSVKKWIFDTVPDIVLPRINKKMLALDKRKVAKGGKGLRKKDGEMRLPSFHYVDDRIIKAGLKSIFGIPTPKPGKRNIYNLEEHSWQALAAVGHYLFKNTPQ